MKRGFTILELLVASILLGMLMTILTMIFNQSSIAWRTGLANVEDLDKVRREVGQVRYEADNLYAWNRNDSSQLAAVLPIWDPENADRAGAQRLRERAVEATGVTVNENEKIEKLKNALQPDDASVTRSGTLFNSWEVSCQSDGKQNQNSYTVNVRSAGPDGVHGTYDDIWSFPDDFD